MCQFYPKNEAQRNMVSMAAVKAGFGAGLLEDGAGTKNAKVYLVLSVGGGAIEEVVEGMDGVDVVERGKPNHERKPTENIVTKGSKQWILRKKEQMERKGKVVKNNSKFSGRRRRIAW